jgi:hypothetical protein
MVKHHIYEISAEEVFYRKLDSFHETYVYHLLLSGEAPKGTSIESIKMAKSPLVNGKYCSRVVGGLLNTRPEISVRLSESLQVRLECLFTRIDDKEHINHTYMIQNVIDWPQVGDFSCQIWYLGERDMKEINKFWEN